MRIPSERTSIPMSATAYVDRARGWARLLEDREAASTGEPLARARMAVARRIAVTPGTLENLRKNRLKTIAVHLYDQLRGGVIRALEAELRHVQHELQIAHQAGLDPRGGEVTALVASHARIRDALNLPAEGVGQ